MATFLLLDVHVAFWFLGRFLRTSFLLFPTFRDKVFWLIETFFAALALLLQWMPVAVINSTADKRRGNAFVTSSPT
ncbi:MAG: hypothetical protein OSJ45_15380 [Lachnospiraceae bacterium]|nr:hypothetical protein [Lachnospiraceae bacterium]